MVNAFVRIDLPDRSPDFQRMALEPGVPLLDRGQTTAGLLRVWLGRFVAEPEWQDSQTVQFYVNDDQGRRINPTAIRLVEAEDAAGILRREVQALRDKLNQIQARGRTEQAVAAIIQERFEKQVRGSADGAFYRYRDSRGKWRLVWCWGFQRSESKNVPFVLCSNDNCHRLYLVRNPQNTNCPKCGTPIPVYRFPWKKFSLATTCLLLVIGLMGWRYWETMPLSSIEGQIVWSDFNLPISGAEVRINSRGAATTSDEQGRFRLESLPAGPTEVTVDAPGFPEHKTNSKLEHSKRTILPIELAADGVLFGRVVDAVSRRPICDATLQIKGTSKSIQSDEKGEFRLEGCRRGTVPVEIVAQGYPITSRDASVADGHDAPAEFEVAGDAVLVGRVISAVHEEPLGQVEVRLGTTGQIAKTDAEGWFAFKQAPHGMQEVIVDLQGFAKQSLKKELLSGQERQAMFHMTGAGKIVGTVVRAIDRSPMSKVNIKVTGTRLQEKSDDEGRFRLEGVPSDNITLEIAAPGFKTQRTEVEVSDSQEANAAVSLVGDATVSGQVVDELTKLPVTGATVRLEGSPFQAKTDAAGKYRLEAVPSLPAKISAQSNGYLVKTADIQPVPEKEQTFPLTLQGNSTISGSVVERWSDAPVAGARITFGKVDLGSSTNGDGVFELKGVRGGVTYNLEVQAEGLAPQTESAKANPDRAVVLKFMMSGAARLTGHVVSVLDESPITGAEVQLHGTAHRVTTDTKGQFVLDRLQIGQTTVEVTATGYETQRLTLDAKTDPKPVLVHLGGNASLTGKIRDAATKLPVAGVTISLANTAVKVKTNDQGAYELKGLFPGETNLTASADGYPAESKDVELVAKRESMVDFILTGTASLVGEIYDEFEKPLENASVQLKETQYHVATDARGNFKLDKLRAGLVEVIFAAPQCGKRTAAIELKLGEVKSLERLKLVTSVTLHGNVANLVTGLPLKNAKCTIDGLEKTILSDASGHFRFDERPAKIQTIRIESDGYMSEQVDINPVHGQEANHVYLCPLPKPDEIVIALSERHSAGAITAHLYRVTEQTADAHVSLAQMTSDNLTFIKGDQTAGKPECFQIHPLTPGRYELVVEAKTNRDGVHDSEKALKRLSQSEAVVKVYRHGSSQAKTYHVGKHKSATFWQPFGVEILDSKEIVYHDYKAEHYRISLPREIRPK